MKSLLIIPLAAALAVPSVVMAATGPTITFTASPSPSAAISAGFNYETDVFYAKLDSSGQLCYIPQPVVLKIDTCVTPGTSTSITSSATTISTANPSAAGNNYLYFISNYRTTKDCAGALSGYKNAIVATAGFVPPSPTPTADNITFTNSIQSGTQYGWASYTSGGTISLSGLGQNASLSPCTSD